MLHATDVAVIGISCRFPGADNQWEFWKNLVDGRNSINPVLLDKKKTEHADFNAVKHCGTLNQLDCFDARFFNISPREAASMDPQQRLLLEEVFHCFEDAGICIEALQARTTSVFVGATGSDYSLVALQDGEQADSYAPQGVFESLIANRVSHVFGLSGVSYSLDAACASSLVSIHEARKSLLTGESDFAISAATNLSFHPWRFSSFGKARMLSAGGQCRTFDAGADGFVHGDGVGVLLLQRLEDAQRDRNRIYAVIRGSAVNHCGKTATITAPKVSAQTRVILDAWESVGIGLESASYIEAHGTGTNLGDPIEIEALTQAFKKHTDAVQFCHVGSVKTNIGHLASAAGMAGIIKVILMMQHKLIPKTLNVQSINPIIQFGSSPLIPTLANCDWQPLEEGAPRRAGVSSFGFGGVNAHVVVEEYCTQDAKLSSGHENRLQPFLLSAKTPEALRKLVEQWRAYALTDSFEQASLESICTTLLLGRESFEYRLGTLVSEKSELTAYLRSDVGEYSTQKKATKWAFQLTGLSLESAESLLGICGKHPLFKKCFDDACGVAGAWNESAQACRDQSRRESALYAFAAEYAFAKSLIDAGIKPGRLIASGSGRWTALALADVFPLDHVRALVLSDAKWEDVDVALPSITLKGKGRRTDLAFLCFDDDYVRALATGVTLSRQEVEHYFERARILNKTQFTFQRYLKDLQPHFLAADIDLAAVLSARIMQAEYDLASPVGLVAILVAVSIKRLNVRWDLASREATHNAALEELSDLVVDGVMQPANLFDLHKCSEAAYASVADALSGQADMLRPEKPYQAIRKHSRASIQSLARAWFESLEDVGQEPDLDSGEACICASPLPSILFDGATIENEEQGPHCFIELGVKAWTLGAAIEWQKLIDAPDDIAKISLPAYPFAREVHWVVNHALSEMRSPVDDAPLETQSESSSCQTSANVENHSGPEGGVPLLYKKVWKESDFRRPHGASAAGAYVVFANCRSRQLAERLALEIGWQDAQIIELEQNRYPERMRSVSGLAGIIDLTDCYADVSTESIQVSWRLAYLQDAIKSARADLLVLHVTHGLQVLGNGPPATLAGAEMAGLIRMLSAEYRRVMARTVDIDSGMTETDRAVTLLKGEIAERGSDATEICYRNQRRFAPFFESFQAGAEQSPVLSPDEVYLITGGTRGIGGAIARHLVRNGARKLVLVGKNALLPRQRWAAVVDRSDPVCTDEQREKILLVQELESLGAVVETHATPLVSESEVRALLQGVVKRLGRIGGVVHCAGVVPRENRAFMLKPLAEMQPIFEPKVSGVRALLAALRSEHPRFCVLFSSVSAVVPRLAVGVSDYAAANAYMDYVAAYHHARSAKNIVSINWLNWQGVGFGEVTSKEYREMGFCALNVNHGLTLFDLVLSQKESPPVVLPCLSDFVAASDQWTCLVSSAGESVVREIHASASGTLVDAGVVGADALKGALRRIFSEALGVPVDEIQDNVQFDHYGADSIVLAEIVKRIESHLDAKIDPTLILQYSSVASLSAYLAANHARKLPLSDKTLESAPLPDQKTAASAAYVEQHISAVFSDVLRMARSELDRHAGFDTLGVDSIVLVELVKRIETWVGDKLDPNILLENSTIARLAAALLGRYPTLETSAAGTPEQELDLRAQRDATSIATGEPDHADSLRLESRTRQQSWNSRQIAIVGMACNFPGAPDKGAFWDALAAGRNCITEVRPERWDSNRFYSPGRETGKSISKWGGFIEGIDQFDPEFFGLKPQMAAHIDPLVRQFLEVSVQTFRDAGYEKAELAGRRIGVFAAGRISNYASRVATPLPETVLGVGQNFIASHVSHLFDLRGPSLVIDTACSSSLVGLHLACRNLLSGECEMALVGGVDILLDETIYLWLSESQALSPDGQCFTFDERANGFVPGEGCGAVLIKPLVDAIRDGDRIYAVIEGSAVNNDGHTMGVTTPSPDAQREVIEMALQDARVRASDISYLEAHGTGTMIGDPIELKAVEAVFRRVTNEKKVCAVGSVKTNIGHLLSAAGMASLIKVILSLHHKQLPPTLNCETPNPRFNFEDSPFYPNTRLTHWNPKAGIRRAGISSFGFSGTNAHVIVKEFSSSEHGASYVCRRGVLPPARFNRRRFWLEKKYFDLYASTGMTRQAVSQSVKPFMEIVEENQ